MCSTNHGGGQHRIRSDIWSDHPPNIVRFLVFIDLRLTNPYSGLYCALLLCHALICSTNPKYMARFQIFFLILNILYVSLHFQVFWLNGLLLQSVLRDYCWPSGSDSQRIQKRRKICLRRLHQRSVFRQEIFTASSWCRLVSGWPNGFAFILSFLFPLWGVGGSYFLCKYILR